jgi:septin 3/9/12
LSDVVNVVPVIAKSDSLTLAERQAFKQRVTTFIYISNNQIKAEVAFHNIKMYPYDNDELDEEERALNTQIKVSPPKETINSRTSSPLQS